jgi:hypothetical protein
MSNKDGLLSCATIRMRIRLVGLDVYCSFALKTVRIRSLEGLMNKKAESSADNDWTNEVLFYFDSCLIGQFTTEGNLNIASETTFRLLLFIAQNVHSNSGNFLQYVSLFLRRLLNNFPAPGLFSFGWL